MTNRALIARSISVATLVAVVVVLWQAVRFCQGHVGAPGFDQMIAFMQQQLGEPPATDTPVGPLQEVIAWVYAGLRTLGGISTWVTIAAAVSSVGACTARIVEVGFRQYVAECKTADEEARRWAKVEADREQRRELRRKRREAQQPKASFGFGALLLGIVIGKIL